MTSYLIVKFWTAQEDGEALEEPEVAVELDQEVGEEEGEEVHYQPGP